MGRMISRSGLGLVCAAVLSLACSLAAAQRIPIPAGFPNAATTGYTGTLTPVGAMTVTVPGTVLENLDIPGTLHIKADNVTVRNCRIRGGGNYGVQCNWGYTGAVIEDCTIDGLGNTGKGVLCANTTIRRCEIRNWGDGIFYVHNTVVEDTWIHLLYYADQSHNDGIQTMGARDCVFRHNTVQAIYRGQTSCMINQSDNVQIDGLLIEDNFFSGGAYTLYVQDRGSGRPLNVTIRNNVFEKFSYAFGIFSGDGDITWECNVFHTGEPIPQNPACSGGVIADAGPDQTVYDADGNGFELVRLDGSGSSCSDGVITDYLWSEGGSYLSSEVSPTVVLTSGTHAVDLKVTADDGDTITDTVMIYVLNPGGAVSSQLWKSLPIAAQTGTFTFEFDATPQTEDMDGVVGLCDGIAATWGDLACIFRFYTTGNMDVRNGGGYGADVTAPYTAGTRYHIRMEVDIPAHTYSVYVTPEGGSQITLASGYAFRSDQSGATELDHWALVHNSGGVVVENPLITAGDALPAADAGPDQTIDDSDGDGSELIQLDGSGSTCSDGTITEYLWAEGGGYLASGVTPSVPLTVGTHTIQLQVTADDGDTDTDVVVVTIVAVPRADAGDDQTLTDDDGDGVVPVTLDGAGSTAPPGATLTGYVWTRDGSLVGTDPITLTVLPLGVHTITLEVTDSTGARATDDVVITVAADPRGRQRRRRSGPGGFRDPQADLRPGPIGRRPGRLQRRRRRGPGGFRDPQAELRDLGGLRS